jgi:actin-related protein
VGNDKLLWSHKHVFLLGLMNPTELKEKMRSNYLKFELHDRDELNNKKVKADVEVFDIGKAIQEEMEKEKPVEEDPKKKGQPKKEDKKEVKKEAKKEAKKKDAKLGEPILPPKKEVLTNNYGVSACSLVEFLKPSMKTARYKIPVVPRNTFEDF